MQRSIHIMNHNTLHTDKKVPAWKKIGALAATGLALSPPVGCASEAKAPDAPEKAPATTETYQSPVETLTPEVLRDMTPEQRENVFKIEGNTPEEIAASNYGKLAALFNSVNTTGKADKLPA